MLIKSSILPPALWSAWGSHVFFMTSFFPVQPCLSFFLTMAALFLHGMFCPFFFAMAQLCDVFFCHGSHVHFFCHGSRLFSCSTVNRPMAESGAQVWRTRLESRLTARLGLCPCQHCPTHVRQLQADGEDRLAVLVHRHRTCRVRLSRYVGHEPTRDADT